MAAVDDLHVATGRDLNLVVGQKHNTAVGGDLQERVLGLRESVAMIGQRLQAPKTWLGSEGVNVLQVLCDLIDLVQEMNAQIAAHVHPQLGSPATNAAAFTAAAAKAALLSAMLGSVTL